MAWSDVWLGVLLAASFGTLLVDLVMVYLKRTRRAGLAPTFFAWLIVCCIPLPFIWLAVALRRILW